MEKVSILSDYTPAGAPNVLNIIYDDQGDVHVQVFQGSPSERGVRIAASGTRHSGRVRQAFWNLIQAYKEELADPDCHPDLLERNE